MTLEEAKQLKPGDVIGGAYNNNRVLTKVWIEGQELCWYQQEKNEVKHSYPYLSMTLEKAAPPAIINTYELF